MEDLITGTLPARLPELVTKDLTHNGERGSTQGKNKGESVNKELDRNSASKPFTVNIELDLMQLLLMLLSLISRTWQIGVPRAVVFDELHFTKFVLLYVKRIFFFDIHPPLGKLLLSLAGSYAGFEGDINFDRIGTEFPPSVPVEVMRLVPAVMGSLVVPIVYQISLELQLTRWSAALAATFVLLDNALLVQSRFMLMEGMLIFFISLSILSFLKFTNASRRQFSVMWWFWLCLTGVAFSCAISVKYTAIFTALLLLYLAVKQFWAMVDDLNISDIGLLKHMCARMLALAWIPVMVYLAVFYVHLRMLSKAGPHDNVMTSAFQASLEGGLASLTKDQPLHVAYGSQITLRHTANMAGHPCWLHSHPHVYPVRYQDSRGSSHQQQVTCYVFKDVNNWWIVKHPDRNSLLVDEKPVIVRHGDIVQLVHGITSRGLNSHDVAAPMTPQNQEVSCYIDYNISMPAQNLWKVDIVNRESDNDPWQTIQSQVRLIHVNTSTALRLTGKQLPDWGFHQFEITSDRLINQRDTVWNVEEHRYSKSLKKDNQTAEVSEEDLLPLEPTRLSFWAKMWELQTKMIMSKQDAELEHKYSSYPSEWPFMARNIAYWMNPKNNAQIHLLGNIVVWCAASVSVVLYIVLGIFYYLRRQRAIFDIAEDDWQKFIFVGELLVGGYLMHYLPFFMADRTLFLHHYLPAVVFKILTLAALVDHLAVCKIKMFPGSSLIVCAVVVLLAGAVYTFLEFLPVSLGNVALTEKDILRLSWRESWDFLLYVRS